MSEGYEVFETDIAIVGMAARLPGARSVDEYWRNLRDGVESVRRYTEEELLAASPAPLPRSKLYVRLLPPAKGPTHRW